MNCDPIARWYRWLEYAAFGGALRKRREAFLFELGNPQKVLVLGDGDGRFLQVFTALYPQAQVDATDVSARMIELSRERVPSDRVTFHLADARDFAFPDNYDLAVAHFFFDCLEQDELEALLTKVHAKKWLISEFRYTPWSRPAVRALYFFFRATTGLQVKSLPDHRRLLEALGYCLDKDQRALAGMLASEFWVRT